MAMTEAQVRQLVAQMFTEYDAHLKQAMSRADAEVAGIQAVSATTKTALVVAHGQGQAVATAMEDIRKKLGSVEETFGDIDARTQAAGAEAGDRLKQMEEMRRDAQAAFDNVRARQIIAMSTLDQQGAGANPQD